MHKTECILHHSLLNRALSYCRYFHILWQHSKAAGNNTSSNTQFAAKLRNAV